ncbi:response regulator [Corynebacterium hansenii]|uniref:Response regulator n=1 Tax=Corynebacterium hansenii TaxID=394964 RepID=A0ABV7ZUN6_9CORY|nr:response regulator [Corynebacterium hansenii]WJY99988.1 Transcriptional activator protein ExaE [Corynebacterium hansenii]
MGRITRRIAAIDDHELSLRGLAAIVNGADDIELVGIYPTVPQLLESTAGSERLDLVVLDLRLGDDSRPEDNVRALDAVTDNVIILSSLESPYLVRRALKAGVLGMVQKSESPATILDAIREAASGRGVPTTEWAAVIDSDPHLDAVELSDRQREVLELYASGEPAKRVARLTGLAQDTVNDYLGRIRLKYAAAGRPAPTKTDLFRRAQEDGLLPGPSDPA